MSSTSEVGNAKNLANLQKLIDLATQIGAPYDPTNTQITLPGLTALQTQCTTDYNSWVAKRTTWKNATNSREIAFKTLPQLCTQISDNVKTLSVPQQTIDDVTALVSNIHGHSNKTKKSSASGSTSTSGNNTGGSTNTTPSSTQTSSSEKPVVTPAPPINLPPANSVSTSHRSFDNMLANFYKLIQLVQSIAAYNPNEASLKVAGLNSTYTNLNTLNNAAVNAKNALSLAVNQRNNSFYDANTGMVVTARRVKQYIKQIEGSTSSIYHAAATIKFVKMIR